MSDTVDEHSFLSVVDCDAVLREVHAQRPAWCRRMEQAPFFTLGTAAYLDAVGADNRYLTLAAASNQILQSRFPELFQRLAARLEEILDAPVAYAGNLAWPGFHVFPADRLFLHPIASVHLDLQYQLVPWPDEPPADFTKPLSFTLPIALPRAGGGLSYTTTARSKPHSSAQLDLYQPYRIGHLYLHSGHLLHQIAPLRAFSPDDQRITLQGHAVRQGGVWQLYW